MFDLPMQFAPGKLVVFEGPDGTGKSTQLARFEEACCTPQLGTPLYDPEPLFTHQPSGTTSALGHAIYDLTESIDWSQHSPLTRQLLHLAAHAEHYTNDIIPALRERSVVMDRCWWSAVAYGWRGHIRDMFSFQQWVNYVSVPAEPVEPDLVFLFLHQHDQHDTNRTLSDAHTKANYRRLAVMFESNTYIVPDLSVGEVTAYIAGRLNERGITNVQEAV